MIDPSIKLNFDSPLHAKLLKALDKRFTLSANRMSNLHSKWRKAEDQFVAYIPESDTDSKKRAAREGQGKQDYTTIILPYTYSMLMSAHSYWTSVFLSRAPIFQFQGRHGESEQQTQCLEALIDYQTHVGRHTLPLYFWLLDVGKYGIGILYEYWCEEDSYISRNQSVPKSFLGIPLGGTKSQIVTEKVPGYYGTKIFNVRPYDWFPDPRNQLWNVQDMEFCGYLSEVSWNAIWSKAQAGEYLKENAAEAKKRGLGGGTAKAKGGTSTSLPNEDYAQYMQIDLADTGPYNILTMHVDLIPSDWGLGDRTYKEKWVFTVVTSSRAAGGDTGRGSLNIILGAKPLGAFHNKHPFAVQALEPDAYNLLNRGLPEIAEPIQRSLDWLINSHMFNVRNALNNQFLYDPSRIISSDFSNPTPGGGIRLKQAAWGTPLDQVLRQIPVQDVTRSHIGDISFLDQFAQKALGINEQIMGMVNSGGRKTATEVRSSSTFGVNRQKTNAEFFSAMGWEPLAELLVQDSQQWFQADLKLKIVGDLAQLAPDFINVTPDAIQGFYDFVPVDGTLPVDRFAQANLWKEIMQAIAQDPLIAQQYDISKIFAWTAQLAGLKNIQKFRVITQPDAMLAGQAQRGNVVPLGPRNPNEPAQIPNVGPTG